MPGMGCGRAAQVCEPKLFGKYCVWSRPSLQHDPILASIFYRELRGPKEWAAAAPLEVCELRVFRVKGCWGLGFSGFSGF